MKNIFVLLSLLPTLLLAQTIEVGEAENKALQFLQTKKQTQSKTQTRASQQEVQLSLAYTSQAGDETYYYVFNNDAGGFVIMGGDEAAKEVLGYSDKGTFDYALIPDNMRWWLSQYDAEISHAIGEVKAGRTSVMKYAKTRSSRPDIPAMLTTEWGQKEPYNCQIPTYAAGYTGENALVTGCVPTAAAQVMRYYEWPDTGVGSATMTSMYHDLTFEADFEHTYYDWAHMADTYTNGTYTGSTEEVAVGTLMYQLGVAVNAEYSTSNTSAKTENLISRLTSTFKYNKGMTYVSRQFYSDAEWEQLIYEELAKGQPVVYGGFAKQDNEFMGHQFVCDGYEDGRWHINWGWYGYYNTTFLLTASATEEALRPAGTGTGGAVASTNYSYYQDAIIGMCPDKDGSSEYRKDSLVITELYLDNNYCYMPGDVVAARVSVETLGKDGYPMQVRYKLVNTKDDNEILNIPDVYTVTITPEEPSFFNATFTIPAEAKLGTTYQVVPMMEDEQGEWRPIAAKPGANFTKLIIPAWSGIGPDDDQSVKIFNNGYISADSPIGNVFVHNYSLKTVTQAMVLWVYPEEGGDSIDYFDLGELTLERNGLNMLDFNYQDLHSQTLPDKPQTLVPGHNYLLRFQNLTTGELMKEAVPLYFRESQTIEFTAPESGWGTLCLPFNYTNLPKDLSTFGILSIDNDELSLLDYNIFYFDLPFIIHGTPGTTYRFSGPVTPVGLRTKSHLTASTECDIYAPKGSYVLQCRDGITGFYKVHEDNQVLVKRYEVYLVPDEECGDFISLGEYYESPTVIEDIYMRTDDCYTQTYNLLGIEVSDDYRGIVISKGKKYIRK